MLGQRPQAVILTTGNFLTDEAPFEPSPPERHSGIRQDVVIPRRMLGAAVVRRDQNHAVAVGEVDQGRGSLNSRLGTGMGQQNATRPSA